jgi:hypothetical protein
MEVMNWLAPALTVATIVIAGIVTAGIIVVIMEVFAPDDCPETPPFVYVAPQPHPCKAIREAQDIVSACWSEEMQQ